METTAAPTCAAAARRGAQGEAWVSFGIAVTLNGWTLTWLMPDSVRIGAMWVAELVSHTGGVVTVRNPSWNANIPAGSSMTIGYFDGGGFFVPSGFALNGVPCAS
jgi:hypothetical protein